MNKFDLSEIINRIDAVPISERATVTQFKHEEDDEPYQVWRIDSDGICYILKEAKGNEIEIYQSALFNIKESIPELYQTITFDKKTYLLMEYAEGEYYKKYLPIAKQHADKILKIENCSRFENKKVR